MTENDLATWQARRLRERLFPMLNYLERLKTRMEKRFDPRDPLFLAVMAAYTSMVDLSMKLHYLSCESGVGLPAKNNAPSGD
jgi:hypothetical protein